MNETDVNDRAIGASAPTVVLVDTGICNLASMRAAFGRLGARVVASADPALVRLADHVVLPGVGSFAAGAHALRRTGVTDALLERIARDQPTLGVCLGLQLLARASAEAPGAVGLGVLPVGVRPLRAERLPQLGWNRVRPEPDAPARFIASGDAAFAHGFAIDDLELEALRVDGWRIAWSRYGERFVAAVERGAILGCQFHPELSGAYGESILRSWLTQRPIEASPENAADTADAPSGLRRIVACLDVADGRVVKGVRFQSLRDMGDPATLAARHENGGADEIVILDVHATAENRGTMLETVRAVRAAVRIPVTVGGGVRTPADAAALLAAGADKVAINSAAVREPTLITRLSDRFGRQCIVVSIDAARRTAGHARGWTVRTVGARDETRLDAIEWATRAEALGAGELLVTAIDRDGTGDGYDEPLMRAIRAVTTIPLVASGGARDASHCRDALLAGADAALVASIVHEGRASSNDIKDVVGASGLPVRIPSPARAATDQSPAPPSSTPSPSAPCSSSPSTSTPAWSSS